MVLPWYLYKMHGIVMVGVQNDSITTVILICYISEMHDIAMVVYTILRIKLLYKSFVHITIVPIHNFILTCMMFPWYMNKMHGISMVHVQNHCITSPMSKK